jgi:NAD(P)-dependent dehydrogenase (short-subunit alcohol dehydrogenase family)
LNTGGNGGVGRAMASRLADARARAVVTGRKEEKNADAGREFGSEGSAANV